jgi:Mn-dependent DtxR family transcriptional regulator
MSKGISSVFFHEKPVMMLIKLKNSKSEIYASTLAKQVDCTYSHVIKMLEEMQKAGLVNFDKKGRLKFLTLTEKGSSVAEKLEQARILMEKKE